MSSVPQIRSPGELPGGGAGPGPQEHQEAARRAAAAVRAPRPLGAVARFCAGREFIIAASAPHFGGLWETRVYPMEDANSNGTSQWV